jgi:hypothetical protein
LPGGGARNPKIWLENPISFSPGFIVQQPLAAQTQIYPLLSECQTKNRDTAAFFGKIVPDIIEHYVN